MRKKKNKRELAARLCIITMEVKRQKQGRKPSPKQLWLLTVDVVLAHGHLEIWLIAQCLFTQKTSGLEQQIKTNK